MISFFFQTEEHVRECVIVVPGFFGQAERTALLTAANLANIKVLQLINDYSAVALNKAIYRRKEFNETATYFAIYDMGAYHTTASVISYQLVKDPATRETNPVIQVVGVGYDRTLGGLEMQIRLRDHLAKEFNAMKKTKTDVFTNPRAMTKLFNEARKLKEVLSANREHTAQIEGLIEEIDFRLRVSRDTFESLCSDLFERIGAPLEQAMKNAQFLSNDILSEVVLFGGGSRVPKVQQALEAYLGGIKLKQYLNMDEAAAIGAVYKAADLVTGLRVAKFVIKDAVLFPIQVTFEREGKEKLFKRNLFNLMTSYPQKRVITFSKNTEDFSFNVTHGELDHLTTNEIKNIGSMNLLKVGTNEVSKLIGENVDENSELKGIKAHFALDESGILSLSSVEMVVDKNETESDEESSLSKLGSTITKLFSGGDDEKKDDEKSADADKSNDTADSSAATNSTSTEEAPPKKAESKTVTIKKQVSHNVEVSYISHLADDKFENARKKIETFTELERKKYHLESVRNELESFIIDAQQNMDDEEYTGCAREEEIENIRKLCTETSDWIYEDGENVDAEVYEEKLTKLRDVVNPVYSRQWEHRERPDALKAFDSLVGNAKTFLESAKTMTKETNPEKDVFTTVEVDVLNKSIVAAEEWLTTEQAAQDKLQKHEDVQLTVQALGDRMGLVDREVKYMINKMKYWKPKVKPTPRKSKKTENQTETVGGEQTEQEKKSEGEENAGDGSKVEEDGKVEKEGKVVEEGQVEEEQPQIEVEQIVEKPTSEDGEGVEPSKPEEPTHTEL